MLSFLNPVSKKELGCEGWSDDRYITEWCDGERNTIVRRIYFTFIQYADIPDYLYSKLDFKAAIDDRATKVRVRHKEDSVPGQLKFGKNPETSPINVPREHPESVSQVPALVSSLEHTLRSLEASVVTRNSSPPGPDAKDAEILALQKRVLQQESLALEAQKQALRTQQQTFEREQALVQEGLQRERTSAREALLREQQLNDNVRANAQAKENMQQYLAIEASRQKFLMELMQNSNFASLLGTAALQPGLLSMMMPSRVPLAPDSNPGNSSSSSSVVTHNLLGFDDKRSPGTTTSLSVRERERERE